MEALPFLQEVTAAGDHVFDQSPKLGTFYADAPNDLGMAIWPEEIDLRVTRPGDVNMCRLVIGGVDDEPEAMSAVDDNHWRK
jgi:hypothetical protein